MTAGQLSPVGAERGRRPTLAAALRSVHRAGGESPVRGVSRADLTRETGLNRSTIAALVAELSALDLVVEREPSASNRVGRPSPVVDAAPGVVAFAVNPEIDAVTVGAVGLGGRLLGRVRRDVGAAPSPEVAAALAATGVDELRRSLPAERLEVGIGAAVPGLVRSDGLVRLAPHLGWLDAPFGELLADATGLAAASANDASCGATAESIFGAGRGVANLVYLNGGASGVGGGVIVDGRRLGGASGYAGELGHTLVNPDGARCHCGSVGCLETEVSRAALLAVAGLGAGDEDRLDAALRDSPDEAVRVEVDRQIDALAVALGNAVNVFDPQLVVLGGFLGSLAGATGDAVERRARARALPGPRDDVRVVRTALGARRLLLGAAELAFAPLLADPAAFARASASTRPPLFSRPGAQATSAPSRENPAR